MRAARNRPEIRKKSGIRKGLAQSMKPASAVAPPVTFSTPSVACIITTSRMQMPFATSTQSMRDAFTEVAFISSHSWTGRDRGTGLSD